MDKYLIDTDVLIDFSKGKDELLTILLEFQVESKVILYITPANISEFLNDKFLLRNKAKEKDAIDFLGNFKTLIIDKKSGILAGKFLREGKTDYITDALLAGCGVTNGIKIVTRNKKHFINIKELKVISSPEEISC